MGNIYIDITVDNAKWMNGGGILTTFTVWLRLQACDNNVQLLLDERDYCEHYQHKKLQTIGKCRILSCTF